MANRRKGFKRATAILTNAGLGAVLILPLAWILQVKYGEIELKAFAHRKLGAAESIFNETRSAVDAVLSAHLQFCSDDELAWMQRYVYSAYFVKEVGRTRDGLLYCTSGLGRLSHPLPMPAPEIAFSKDNLGRDLIEVIPNATLLTAPLATGMVIENRDVSVVLNPSNFPAVDQPPMWVSVLGYDSRNHRGISLFGRPLVLSDQEIFSRKAIYRDGVTYQTVCSGTHDLCVVAGEPKESVYARGRPVLFITLVFGALLGILRATLVQYLQTPHQILERNLRRAVRKRQIDLAYQPIVDLNTGGIVGAEALARWTNPAGEAVSPDVFISVAEQKGFIGEITRIAIDKSISELGDLLCRTDFRVTVNIAASDLGDESFFEHVEHSLRKTGLRPEALGFELTERSTVDRKVAINAIRRLRERGHSVYLDDFGTGYSSLSYLRDLCVDAIKIDRSFTQTVETEAVTASIVPQIIQIAEGLELRLVVEGIETAVQKEYFRTAREGTLGQGWLFGKPIIAKAFKSLYASRRQMHSPGASASPQDNQTSAPLTR